MSVFPKRVGHHDSVIVHCNISTANLRSGHLFPRVVVEVVGPDGGHRTLVDTNVFGAAYPAVAHKDDGFGDAQGIRKSVPLVVLAGYLSGTRTTQQLVDILRNIENGRHYYYSFTVPPDAPLGRYEVSIQIEKDGRAVPMSTPDDYFLVERLHVSEVPRADGRRVAKVTNDGPQDVNARLLRCVSCGKHDAAVPEIVTVPAQSSLSWPVDECRAVLLYNEDRRALALRSEPNSLLLRNQRVATLRKDESLYLFDGARAGAWRLSDTHMRLWERADGLLSRQELDPDETRACEYMLSEGLLQTVDLG